MPEIATPAEFTRRTRVAFTLGALAASVAGGWGLAAEAQRLPWDIQPPDPYSDGYSDTAQTDVHAIWARYDDAVDPQARSFASTRVLPELIVYEIIDAMSREAFARAEEKAKMLVQLAPTRPAAHYNYACALSRSGKLEQAIDALETAIRLGFRHSPHVAADPDLDALRNHPRFAAAMQMLRDAINEEAIISRPLRTDEPQQVILEDVSAAASKLMERYQVPGVSIALVRDGEVVWADAFGRPDERLGEPLRSTTLFELHAPSRLLIALQALRIAELGGWDLDDQITRWLPPLSQANIEGVERVTVRDVLNFTSGFTHQRIDAILAGVDEEIRATLTFQLARHDVKYTYVPEVYLAAGRAVEEALIPEHPEDPAEAHEIGRPLAEHLRSSFLIPLQMKHTLSRSPSRDSDRVRLLATGHSEYGSPYRHALTPLRPDSPMYTTASDLARLMAFLMDSENYERAPLERESIEELYQPGLSMGEGENGFGLGIRIRNTPFGRCAESSGVAHGVGSLMRWYPDSRCGVVILFNGDNGLELAQRLANLALGGI